MGLVTYRRVNESIAIGEAVLTVLKVSKGSVTFDISAPQHVLITRPGQPARTELPLADRLVAGVLAIEAALKGDDYAKYSPILEQTRAMIRREEQNT